MRNSWFIHLVTCQCLNGQGGNLLIAVLGVDDAQGNRFLNRALYFRWSEHSWKSFLIADVGSVQLLVLDLKVLDDTYAISGMKDQSTYLFIGRYDQTLDTVVFVEGVDAPINCHLEPPLYVNIVCDTVFPEVVYDGEDYQLLANKLAVTKDFVVFAGWHNLNAYRYDPLVHQWTFVSLAELGTNVTIDNVAMHPNGISCSYYVNTGGNKWLATWFFEPQFSGFAIGSRLLDARVDDNGLKASHNTLAASLGNTAAGLFVWDGLNWAWRGNYITTGETDTRTLHLYPDNYVWGPTSENTEFRLGRRFGDTTWTDQMVGLSNTKPIFATSSNAALCLSGTEYGLYYFNSFLDSTAYQLLPVDTLAGWSYPIYSTPYLAGRTALVRTRYSSANGWSDVSAYKFIDGTLRGKPQLVVVDSVILYEHLNDANPTIIDYDYSGGLLDASGATPRFCEARKSTPYSSSDGTPEGWSIHYFYNDVDSTHSVFNLQGINGTPLPADLSDSDLFGAEGGGFRLDGLQYLSYTFSDGEDPLKRPPDGKIQDSVRSFYSVYPAPDVFGEELSLDIYRVRLDSTWSIADSLISEVSYRYDTLTGQVTETFTRHLQVNDTTYYYVNHMLPAFRDPLSAVSDSTDDNALSLVSEKATYYIAEDSQGDLVDTLLMTKSRTDFAKRGGWKGVRSYTWRDIQTQTDTIVAADTVDGTGAWHDQYGRIVAAKDASGLITVTKYDADANRIVAAGTNTSADELLVLDFEQPDDWDGWDLKLERPYVSLATGDGAFTGDFGYKLEDTPDADRSWGAQRYVKGDSLTSGLYYFSCWVKSNHRVRVYCWCLEPGDSTYCPEGYKHKDFSGLDSLKWQRIEGVFDLRDLGPGCLSSIKLELVLDDGPTGNEYAYFDNFVFKKIDATVSTTVVDTATGVATAVLGDDNIPVFTSYDEFLRPCSTFNETGLLLSTVAYDYSEGYFQLDTLSVTMSYPATGSVEDSVTLESDQQVSYKLRFLANGKHAAYAKVYRNGVGVATLDCNDIGWCDLMDNGSFAADSGDVITVKTQAPNDGLEFDLSASVYFSHLVGTFSPTDPHAVVTTSYVPGQAEPAIAVSYYNGKGELLQTRATNVVDGVELALVSGPVEKDARGAVQRSYRSFYDLSGSTGVWDYSDTAQAKYESELYNGPIPYQQFWYTGGVKSRLSAASSAGTEWQGKTVSHAHGTDPSSGLVTDTTTDQDGVKSISVADQWGRFATKLSPYDEDKSIAVTSFKDIYGRDTAVYMDTLSESGAVRPFRLRASTFDESGRLVETWKVDYGSERYFYDKLGSPRFTQNDKQELNDQFTYRKYDKLGRLIEEGVMHSATTEMTQSNADDVDYPYLADSADVAYRWYYDYYIGGDDTLTEPGSLVRVESGDLSYYRNFYSHPENLVDSVIAHLPMNYKPLKKIAHFYNPDGSLDSLVVYPDTCGGGFCVAGSKNYHYKYDEAGRLSAVVNGRTEQYGNYYAYAEYDYDAEGAVITERLGVEQRQLIPDDFYDTTQVINYTYNDLGMLVGINWDDTGSTVVSTLDGYGDHFGLKIDYTDNGNGYYNGRVKRVTSHHSDMGGVRTEHKYEYDYDVLGWLREAEYGDPGVVDPEDQVFYYNRLGHRDSVITGTSAEAYTYYPDPDSVGTSRLLRIGSMGAASMIYDTLGNLVADSSLPVYYQAYDYRDMLVYSRVEKNIPLGFHNELRFTYDESGRRIAKKHEYYQMEECGGPIEIDGLEGMGFTTQGVGGGGELCPEETYSKTTYLYDGGALLATFDRNGAVQDMYVNGPSGRIAQYFRNDGAQLIYHLTDHLGSPRILLRDPVDTSLSPVVSHVYAYYPYGELLQSWGGNESIHQFTGHEKDDHSSFDYLYFGARYYDARLGMFTSLDKAGQFASGYVYGANNPTMGVDPDGNWFWALALAMAKGAAISGGLYTFNYGANGYFHNEWGHDFLGGFGQSAAIGAAGAGVGFGVKSAWSVSNANMAAIRGGASGLASNSLGNVLSGRDFFAGVGISVGFGAFFGAESYLVDRQNELGDALSPSPVDAPDSPGPDAPVFASESAMFADYYEEEATGHIIDLPIPIDPGEGYRYIGEELKAETLERIDFSIQKYIPNVTGEFEAVYRMWADRIARDGRYLHRNFLTFAGMSLSSDPYDGLNFKMMRHLTIGRGHSEYSIVHGMVMQNQDIGNLLWARIGKRFGFSLSELRQGAGFAQILNNQILGNRPFDWWALPWYFDDPRDQIFIVRGYRWGQ